jgi:hypothetical protein
MSTEAINNTIMLSTNEKQANSMELFETIHSCHTTLVGNKLLRILYKRVRKTSDFTPSSANA